MQVTSTQPNRRQSVADNLRLATRRMIVMGPPGSGKSTFSASASKFAGDTLPVNPPCVAEDVVVIQGDTEGMLGPLSCGISVPHIFDMTDCPDWDTYMRTIRTDLRKEILPMVQDGQVRIIIVDMSLVNTLINAKIMPDNQKAWGAVKYEGMMFYKLFSSLRGCTVIANAQIKTTESPGETIQAAAAATARAVGGERSLYTADVYKGVGGMWADNSSLTVSIERKQVKDPANPAAKKVLKSTIYTQTNARFEGKSRFGSALLPEEPGSRTLYSIMKQVYGESL